jgi:hypothetical protein
MSIFETIQMPVFSAKHSGPSSGTIISDGCRDYVVAIKQDQGTKILTNRRGKPLTFASLAAAKQRLLRANVDDIQLAVRVAADEACAGATLQDSGFATVKVAQPATERS